MGLGRDFLAGKGRLGQSNQDHEPKAEYGTKQCLADVDKHNPTRRGDNGSAAGMLPTNTITVTVTIVFTIRPRFNMRKFFSISVMAIFLVLGSYFSASAETVSIGGATADVGVYYNQQYGYAVGATIHVEKGSPVNVGCLFLNSDFRYELRNSSNRVVPILQSGLAIADGPREAGPAFVSKPNQSPGTCERRLPNEDFPIVRRAMRLSALYPNLPLGSYTLRITFAPQGLSEQAQLAPITIVVDKNHPIL